MKRTDSGLPKYIQLKNFMKDEILSGRILPGEQIYSENILAQKFSMSRHTVRKAISDLINEGWLFSDHGRGTFCTDKRDMSTHAVMDEYLPDGKTKLEHDWALQHPEDYMEVIRLTIPAILKESGVNPDDIIGVGIDFTACTILPVDKDGVPLCFKDEFKSNPHSYVKLWKHHAAQPEANKLNDIARQRGEKFLDLYGGKISSEWLVPKAMQVLDEAPDVYEAADKFLEATDWVNFRLTGQVKRNSCTARL